VERVPSANDAEKFATYYRDAKTGLDYAINRYYWSGTGRFLSPDPGPYNPTDPGSWNRYTYGANDPVNNNDSSGMLPANVGYEGSAMACVPDPLSTLWLVDASNACPPGFRPDYSRYGSSYSALQQLFDAVDELRRLGGPVGWASEDGSLLWATFTSGNTATIAAGICLAQPEVCAIGAGAVFTIYVSARYLPRLIEAIRRGINARDAAPVRYDPYPTTKDPDGNCDPPDPEKKVKWRGSDGSHWHYIEWHQNPVDCMNYPKYQTGPDPGPGYREIPR
jgi:RHS repeat-associated protein